MTKKNYLFVIVTLFFCSNAYAVDIEKWKQFQVSFTNTTWSDNPFDLGFTHTLSGRELTQLSVVCNARAQQF